MVLSRDQNAGRSHIIKMYNRSFKYLETTLINQSSIQEEIKNRLKSGNASCHLGQNILSSRLLLKNLKIKVYRTIILPAVLYGFETLPLTLGLVRRLRVFRNRVLRRILGLRGTR